MNNFILSFIFLICIMLYYILIGSFVLIKINIKKNSFGLYVIIGWLITFALGWITGFPAQLNAKSWLYFANHFQIALIIFGLIALFGNIFIRKEKIMLNCQHIKEKPIILFEYLLNHLKKYWLIYLFVGIFTWFSLINLQPYTLGNYTDDHYIVKMVQNYKASSLLTSDVTTGNLLHNYGKYGYAKQFSYRMFNTYEISYTYFANLFGIDVVAFVRFAMTIHNYLIWFFSFQLVGSIFVDSEISQFTILPFILLLIPEGYAARGMSIFKIRIFENWRNQTGMYMGGSIVRNVTFALLIYFTYFLMDKKKPLLLLLFPVLALTLISYQTTAISYFIIFFLLFLIYVILKCIWDKFEFDSINSTNFLITISASLALIVFYFVFIIYIDHVLNNMNVNSDNGMLNSLFSVFTLSKGINISTLTKVYNGFVPYYNNVFKLDTFAKIAPIILVISLLASHSKEGRLTTILILILFLVFKINKTKILLSLVSFEHFETARILHSIILLIIFIFGVDIVFALEWIKRKIDSKYIRMFLLPIVSLCLIVTSIGGTRISKNVISKYTKPGDGLIKEGYSSKTITSNDKMMANMFVEIGDYFNQLPNKKYEVFTFDTLNYRGLSYDKIYLLLCSNKIAYAHPYWVTYNYAVSNKDNKTINDFKIQDSANWWINEYLVGKSYRNKYEFAKDAINKSEIRFAVFTNKKYANALIKHNWKLVCGGQNKGFWIVKRN